MRDYPRSDAPALVAIWRRGPKETAPVTSAELPEHDTWQPGDPLGRVGAILAAHTPRHRLARLEAWAGSLTVPPATAEGVARFRADCRAARRSIDEHDNGRANDGALAIQIQWLLTRLEAERQEAELALEVMRARDRLAAGRHRENRDMKQEVLGWYDEHWHEFDSKNKAAEEIHRLRLVPVKCRTIRDWLIGA